MNWLNNICCLTDSYKVSHARQYPPQTQTVYSYFESRPGATFRETVFFGLQYFLETYLTGPVVTAEKIAAADELFHAHFGARVFDRSLWQYILEKHGGRLPVSIRAVPEGTVVPEGNVLITVENTDPKCFWLTNYLETLLVQSWYPCTVASQGRAMKQLLVRYLDETGDPKLVGFKLHDFGFRGCTSPEQAALGGAAHLVHFQGTDNVAGLLLARAVYQAEMPGFSIPAAEHSTITSWGPDHELDALRNMLVQFPTGLVACVSDSFDIYRACREYWGGALKEQVLAREGVLVVRPDSGDPPTVVVEVLRILGEKFGATTNDNGFRLLHPKVRVIQGDGIDLAMLEKILAAVKAAGWSADNLAFGSGGGLLQKLHRDTQRFAFKCSAVTVGGIERPVFKQPVTDAAKNSKSGRLKLIRRMGGRGLSLATVPQSEHGSDLLVEVFRDGKLLKRAAFDDIRHRAAAG